MSFIERAIKKIDSVFFHPKMEDFAWYRVNGFDHLSRAVVHEVGHAVAILKTSKSPFEIVITRDRTKDCKILCNSDDISVCSAGIAADLIWVLNYKRGEIIPDDFTNGWRGDLQKYANSVSDRDCFNAMKAIIHDVLDNNSVLGSDDELLVSTMFNNIVANLNKRRFFNKVSKKFYP